MTSHPAAKEPLSLPDKPSIAVLPFQNMSGDPEQKYFADGVVEDIITALSGGPSGAWWLEIAERDQARRVAWEKSMADMERRSRKRENAEVRERLASSRRTLRPVNPTGDREWNRS